MIITYIVPALTPYAIPRYQALAKLPDTEVHVIVEENINAEHPSWYFREIDGVHMHLVNNTLRKNFVLTNKNDKYYAKYTRIFSFGLKQMIKEINSDIVLVCNSTQIMMLIGKQDNKLGVVVEDTLRCQESRSRFKRIIKKAMLKRADFYIPFTTDAMEFLKFNDIYEPIIHSSWSIDIPFFADLDDDSKKQFRIVNGIDAKINFVLVANLIPRKGVIQFLDGWFAMNQTFHQDSKLFILGDGELYNQIDERLRMKKNNNVKLLGNKSYKEVSHYLQCCDIFVLPTLEDLCSLSVLEAMASGRPVLTTIYNGARDFVKDGVNGYIFDVFDKESTTSVLEKVQKSDLRKMSAMSKQMILDYSTDKVMSKLRSDLEKIV